MGRAASGYPAANECSRLDLAWLMRAGAIVPGRRSWADVEQPGRFRVQLDANLTASGSWMEIRHLDRPELAVYRLRLEAVPQRLGGVRWWFVCHRTGKRARVLLMPYGSPCFASRGAYSAKLSYRSQREMPVDRLRRRARKTREALGLHDLDLGVPIPHQKPHRMRWTTFQRLHERALQADEAYADEMNLELCRSAARILGVSWPQ